MGDRTPRWWRSLPTWSQVTILAVFLPGALVHELVHAITAKPFGAVAIDWDALAWEAHWESESPAPRAAAHIAPLGAGYAVAMGAVGLVLARPAMTIHAGIMAYVAVNWLILTVASASDVLVTLHYLRAWVRGESLPAAS